jgi:ribose transport system ATP-binding protein
MHSGDSPIVALRGVFKKFPDFFLNDISIDLYPGEAHVIIGENGSGKSMLMRLISGIYSPDSGALEVNGDPVEFASIHDGRSAGILYVHQDVQSFDNLSVAENVYFNRLPRRWGIKSLLDRNRVVSDCRRVFRALGISVCPESMMGSLGYAERQLIAAVRAYVTDAVVTIFDEPTSAMTEPDRQILFRMVDRLKQKRSGVFYISHRIDEIERIADRVSVMHHGRIVGTRLVSEADSETLFRMMAGEGEKKGFPRLQKKPGPVIMRVRNLSSAPILQGVEFDVRQREILGITGLMGSGRTLLANCLFGNVKPDSGTIELDGENILIRHPNDAMSAGISLIPEDRSVNGVFPRHNLIANSTIAALPRFRNRYLLDREYMEELTTEITTNLDVKPGQPTDLIGRYSGGNQQKVLVARWLMGRSRVYIMDEPTRGIDIAAKVDIYNAMNDLISKGSSIILISSEIEEIIGMCDRVLVLAGGKIAAEMDSTEATKEKILEYATED